MTAMATKPKFILTAILAAFSFNIIYAQPQTENNDRGVVWTETDGVAIPLPPKEHPRLYLRSDDIPNLKERLKTPEGKAIVAKMKKAAKPRTVEEEAKETDRGFRYYAQMRGVTSQSQLDALAIAIGTSHGAYKFTRRPTGEILSIARVKEIHERLPNTHLVMHGSSSVPQEYLAEIREFGGDMRETYGVPVEEIQEAIKHGVRKVNIDTDIRLAMTAAVRRYLVENPSGFDPRAYLKKAREEAYKLCKSRYLAFGCEGQGAKIKPIGLSVMAAHYADGTLAQNVR